MNSFKYNWVKGVYALGLHCIQGNCARIQYRYHRDLLQIVVFHPALSPQTAPDTFCWQPSFWPSFASYGAVLFVLLPTPRRSCFLLRRCYVTSLGEGVIA